MEVTLETIQEKMLVGMRKRMSYTNNLTRELWQGFRPRCGEVKGRIGSSYFSMQVLDEGLHFKDFTPATQFDKWAAIEVDEFVDVPAGMESYTLPGGQYAVFTHHGPARAFAKTFGYIFNQWLPASGYELDQRPHFEVLGPEYRPDDPNATEKVWIPIRS